ncbi:hypothetical protein [Rhodococcus ruber]
MPTIAETLAALQSAALNGKPVDVAAYAKAKQALAAEKILTEAALDAARDREQAALAAATASADEAHQRYVDALVERARKA